MSTAEKIGMKQNKKIYAVTGGIGCGKTAVSDILREEGYPVFSCDEVYAEMTRGGELVNKLEDAFGNVTMPDGSLNRAALSERVFKDKAALLKLNGITHPAIMREIMLRAEKHPSNIVFCEVPLLFENGFQNLFSGVIVVMRPLEQRISAVKKRSNLSREEVLKRVRAQCDYEHIDLSGCNILHNEGNLEDLREKIKKILKNMTKLT